MDNTIWLEKYRPQTLADVIGNEQILIRLMVLCQEKNIPNMILSGPPGCGKTSAVLALAHDVLQENFKNATIELNASDERGIDVVREKIKQFAEKKVRLEPGHHKVIILDEADSLTEAAQQALRMIISDYSESTRFVFSCNDSTKLIEPLQSRCALLKFLRLSEESVIRTLTMIAKKEGYAYDKTGIEYLALIADGDMRNGINNLQAVCLSSGKVTEQEVIRVCDVPKIEDVINLFSACSRGDLENALTIFNKIWAQEYSVHDLINFFGRILENMTNFNNELRFIFVKHVGRLKFCEMNGMGSKIQILGFIADLCEESIEFARKERN